MRRTRKRGRDGKGEGRRTKRKKRKPGEAFISTRGEGGTGSFERHARIIRESRRIVNLKGMEADSGVETRIL